MLSRLTRHRYQQHYTRHMQQKCILLLLCLGLLAACAPGHSGEQVVAFIRDGKLWTIDANGNNAFAIVAQSQPVVGYAWSPTHQILAFRMLDPDYNKTAEAKTLVSQNDAPVIPDAPSTLNTIGVDGGSPITIAFSSPEVSYNDPFWSSNGSRLMYRQAPKNFAANPSNVQWWIAQNDQPGGIAAKAFAPTFSIPSISDAPQNYMILGNNSNEVFTTNITAGDKTNKGQFLAGHPLPATLERLLWRPAHRNQSFLYASEKQTQESEAKNQLNVQLIWQTLEGPATPIATCTCTQFAWSPDGNTILYNSGNQYTLYNVQNSSHFTINAEDGAVPSWSPDSKFLLLDGSHQLSLVNIASKTHTQLLSAGNSSPDKAQQAALGKTNTLLQPVGNSPWSSDSQRFIFLSHGRLNWQNQTLSDDKGLYVVSINAQGEIQGKPGLITSGQITQPGWTHQDPNTSFLY
ncbi:hypothetical protein KDA_39330 [Dictyobacter alpinus]|uniref:Lipoprotein LpqB beta-propeller domain-containing protein n=1 Tax=Dictyobacter alpinus TaxID=2014873 RepID=A0A402BAU9_9CHLR|nr:PD40 domain-containing protein [Dictyobacter alpinus]GCE28449.1 hypothetical protein KDA_39330 [Dictyobacter alpinus]